MLRHFRYCISRANLRDSYIHLFYIDIFSECIN